MFCWIIECPGKFWIYFMHKNTQVHTIMSLFLPLILQNSVAASYHMETQQKRTPFLQTTTSGCFWSSLLLLSITLFVFDSNSKSFKEFKSSISFSLKSLSSVLFSIFFFRSSRPEVFCKKGVLRNFVKFTGKHLHQRLFIKSGCFCFFHVFCVFLNFVSFFLVARCC